MGRPGNATHTGEAAPDRDRRGAPAGLRPAPRASVLLLCFRFSRSKERRRQVLGPERARKETRPGRKAGGASETSAQGSRAFSGAGLGGWGLGSACVCVCTAQSREGRVSQLLLVMFSLLSPLLSSPANSKTRCCYLAQLSSQFTSRSQSFLLVSLWFQGQTWCQSDPRGPPKEWSWRRLHLLLIL